MPGAGGDRIGAEGLLGCSDLALITTRAKKGRGLPEIIKLRTLSTTYYSFYTTT